MKILIKQVPNAEPNAEGEWICREVDDGFLENRLNLWGRLSDLCDQGHHSVTYERIKGMRDISIDALAQELFRRKAARDFNPRDPFYKDLMRWEDLDEELRRPYRQVAADVFSILCAPEKIVTGNPSPQMREFMLNDITADSSADAGGTAVLAVLSDSQGNSQIIDLVPKEEKP